MSLPAGARRIVLKVGSALLVDWASGEPARGWLAALAADIAAARATGRSVLVVSSGAVALGRRVLGLAGKVLALEEKQAAAAAGQARLMAAWGEALAPHGVAVAQALLTTDDTERRRRWLNARATLETLLALGALPVVNENDTVATEEIRYGDNDRLAARVAQMTGADALILFSDVDGLYDKDPRAHADAAHVAHVPAVTPAIEAMAGGANAAAGVGSGGMRTKIDAAKIATGAGCAVAIMDAREPAPLSRLAAGARCTWFHASTTPEAARRGWLGAVLKPQGAIRVDAGAARALLAGKSLLPAGVTAVEGGFERGDAVAILDPDGRTLARGLSAYDAADADRIKGRRTSETEAILGYRGRPALVHRDDLVLSEGAG